MSKVFVVDADRKPLDPVHPGYARLLLTQRKAAVLRRFPFTIMLKAMVEHPQVQSYRVKLDPGSKTTGLAIARWELFRRLQALGMPLECGTGGRTKWNRISRGLGKTHWLDAACVGASMPDTLQLQGVVPLLITATGHGCRQKCLMNELGFPLFMEHLFLLDEKELLFS